ncbi:hypothetical protein GOP47_0024882 [Adiantum capillus-veneris]|uniref:Piezo non-specific cation channel R-Ras-binding domain-containing protein n=1 Tax=Adiantum capillus-veneris TaxID=13818 RepID=A0A9D4U3L6_ADICA|nr:hypothetical protein GOP47_0024882 [Adiantum capillus-veneris]
MQLASIGAFAPAALLLVSFEDFNLLTLPFLLAFLCLQYKSLWTGISSQIKALSLGFIIAYSVVLLFLDCSTTILWYIKGKSWNWTSHWFPSLLGLDRLNPWTSIPHIFLVVGSLVFTIITAARAIIDGPNFCSVLDFSWGSVQFRAVIRSIILPTVQLVAAVARPCWICFPFFICSCIGLFHWAITGNFVGLSWGWNHLLVLTGLEILVLYVYQLPLSFPETVLKVSDYLGLFRFSQGECGWLEMTQSISLLSLYILLSVSIFEVQEEDGHVFHYKDLLPQTYNGSVTIPRLVDDENGIKERLLASSELTHAIRKRSSVSWTRTLPSTKIMQIISINYSVYGFPICLFLLSLWSFKYASISAFFILVYVGLVLYSFPSVLVLWRMNTVLLLFILFWAICTYTFNAAFTVLHDALEKDTDIWNTVGFWHYPVPGLFLLVQFILGMLLGASMYFSNVSLRSMNVAENSNNADDIIQEESHDGKILFLAILTWCIHRSSHTLSLVLLFFSGVRLGFIGAIYMIFFLAFLLKPDLSTRMRHYVIIFCGTHVAMLYLLRLTLIADQIAIAGNWIRQVLIVLGLSETGNFLDFVMITTLLVFSSLQVHGFRVLLFIARLVRRSQLPPFGLKIFKSTTSGLILLSVCASSNLDYFYQESNLTVQWILKRVSDIGGAIHVVYRTFGTLIATVTVLLVVYRLGPNCISFGYFLLLLFWVTGRQLIGKTRTRLWAPLFIYAVAVFIVHYIIAGFPVLEEKLGEIVSLSLFLGFTPEASFVGHLWDSLLILIVMQLFRYDRAQKFEGVRCSIGDHIHAFSGCMGLIRRCLILHTGKLLLMAVFYASMSPIGLTGFLYLVMLVGSSILPKRSRVPAKMFAFYTALLSIAEFLYQMLGQRLELFPDQIHGPFCSWVGFQVFSDGFWGLEAGFRSRVLVFACCTLQYSAFCWAEQLPASLLNDGKYNEPCCLFVSYPQQVTKRLNYEHDRKPLLDETKSRHSTASFEVPAEPSILPDTPGGGLWRTHSFQEKVTDSSGSNMSPGLKSTAEGIKYRGFEAIMLSSPSSKKTRQWSKRAMLALRKERYEAQLRTLRIYAKHLAENFFNLFGVEICMLVLLFASFSVLNVLSLVYAAILSLCILLNRNSLKAVWPYIVIISSAILVAEYILYARGPPDWNFPQSVGGYNTRCHTCWSDFQADLDYCSKCWLGVMVDDWQTIIAYFMVFFVCSLKLKSNIRAGSTSIFFFHEVILSPNDKLAWREITYETKGQWTWLDRLRFFTYLHFLDVVLLLVFITGTFEYDLLHLGYLAFALIFFRMRVKILKTRNRIFRYLRLYNFVLIVLSLLYQAPYFGDSISEGNSIFYMIGLVKMAYGFDITSQTIVIDITIFFVVLIQSAIFRSKEFEQVLRYLEAEEMDARLEAQEAKAAWKTEQLHCIRNMEEIKQQRRMQVEKMKAEMLNVHLDMDALNSRGKVMEGHVTGQFNDSSRMAQTLFSGALHPDSTGEFEHVSDLPQDKIAGFGSDNTWRRRSRSFNDAETSIRERIFSATGAETQSNLGGFNQRVTKDTGKSEILEEDLDKSKSQTNKKKSSFVSTSKRFGVQMIGDGVAQVQTLGNKALENLTGFLNIEKNESDDTEGSSVEGEAEDVRGEADMRRDGSFMVDSRDKELSRWNTQEESFKEMLHHLSVLYLFCFSKIRSNIDIVCYFFFLIVFIWEFSLLMLVYAVLLFLYALLVNPSPSQMFWLGMLIYTEANILVQYMSQVVIHHTEQTATSSLKLWLERVGIPTTAEGSSFVGSVIPLFLVYLATLVQSSIKARDGEWMSVTFRRLSSSKIAPRSSWKVLLPYYTVKVKDSILSIVISFGRYCFALVHGSEAPPHFVQVTMLVKEWPKEGIQPGRIESDFNRLLTAVHHSFCTAQVEEWDHSASSVRVESIESSQKEEDAVVAVLEVIFVASKRVCPASHQYSSLTPAKDIAWEIQKAKDEGLVEGTCFPFPILSVIAGGKREVDLYAYIFGCDLLAFFLVAIFYQSFIKNSPEFLTVYQLEDQFPKEFVFVLMTLFFLIVVDRVIYLWSFGIGKVGYYLFNLGLFGYYVTHYGWKMSGKVHGLLLLRIFCLVKGLSLSLQALQIKYGLPHKTALYRQFLTRKVSHMNHICFRIYRSLPFLFELRCILDWSCSTTSLTMYDWLKLEDIYASLYIVKCDGKLSREKHQLGEKRGVWPKFFSGICTFLVLIFIIWAPMLIYSSGNPTNFANPVLDAHVQIDLNTRSGKFMLYHTSLCSIYPMENLVESEVIDDSHLEDYDLEDVQLICCESDADNLWLVPPPTLRTLLNSMQEDFSIIARWEFSRQRPKTKELALFSNESSSFDLIKDSSDNLTGLLILDLHPQYFRITSTGEVRMLEGTTDVVSGNLSLTQAFQSWWSFLRDNTSSPEACGNLKGPYAIAVSEEVPQGLIGDTLSKFSITSLYITFVLAVGRFIRLQCADLRMRIPYENFSSCDRLMAICEDIYAARAAGELVLEEGLFWTIIRIYRSPHALLEYTKLD